VTLYVKKFAEKGMRATPQLLPIRMVINYEFVGFAQMLDRHLFPGN